jgi:hypothetical protein
MKLALIVLTTPLWILPVFILLAILAYTDAKYQMFKEENGYDGEY